MTPPYVISIHGVGIHPDGAIVRHVEDTLRRAEVEANVSEFNWDRVSPHFLDVDDGIGDFLRQASESVFAATGLGFVPPHLYPFPAALRVVDRICSFLTVAAFSLGCTLALIFPFTAALYLVVFSVYAELSWTDFAWARGPATRVVLGLFVAALASAALAIVAAGLVAPLRGRWVLHVFLRRYVLLILSRILVVVTVPLRFPLRAVFLVFAPFAVIYLALAMLPFSYNGIFFSERLASARLPLKLGIGLLAGWAGSSILVWLLSKWISGPLEVTLDIARYLCDPRCRAGVQRALDERIRSIPADARIVLLAHSLGSVIAVDSLINSSVWRGREAVVLVTLGSPIRRAFVRFFPGFLFPAGVPDTGRLARTRVGSLRWINVYRRLDFVGQNLDLPPDVGIDVPTRQWRGHAGYWNDDQVLGSVLHALGSPAAVTEVQSPARSEVWIPTEERRPPALLQKTITIAQIALFLVTLVGVLWLPGKALTVRDESLDATVATVLERGRTYSARITHWEDPQPGSNEAEYYYTDEFVFEYRDELGADRRHEEHVDSWVARPKSLRRFDHQRLREHVRRQGKITGDTAWYRPDITVPAQVENVTIRVLPTAPELVVIPEFRSRGDGGAFQLRMRLFWTAVGLAVAGPILFGIFVGRAAR
jgi:hypothetical protein